MRTHLIVIAIVASALTACADNAVNRAITTPKSRLDVHLVGNHIVKFPLAPRFVEVRREIIQGKSDGKGGCSVYIAPDSVDNTKAGQVVERDQTTCQYVVSHGYYTDESTSASGSIDTIAIKRDPNISSARTMAGGVHPLISSRTVKYRAGYKRVVGDTWAFYNQVELTWSYNGSIVSNGSLVVLGYHDVGWTNTGTGTLTKSVDLTFYEAAGYSNASNVSDGSGDWCSAVGTTTGSAQPHVWGYQTGLDAESQYLSISGVCASALYEAYELA